MSEADITGDMGAGRQRKARYDLPGNSQTVPANRPEAPKPKQEKVITGEVTQRKQGMFSRLKGDFIAEDGRTVVHYVLSEVLLPAAKKTISDMVSQGVERALWGDGRPARGVRPGYTNYAGAALRAAAPLSDPRPALSRQARANHEFGEILIASRVDAEEVLDKLREIINLYNMTSVADFKECVGLPTEFTDNTWGWTDLRSAQIRAVRGGYVIDLPRTQALA
jgi:hypothetical protein